MKIENSIVLVTGASSGIGAATARAMARRGAQVILAARTQPALESAAADIRSGGGRAHVCAVDLADPGAVERTFTQIVAEVGHPDIVVNSAGAGRWLFAEETSPAEMTRMMAVPYFAAFYVTRLCLPEMIRRGRGHVVNINSPVTQLPWPGATGYGAGRFAMHGFTTLLRLDLHGTGVRVTSIVPGRTDTPYFDNNPGVLDRAPKIAVLIPTVTPEQVAEATVRAVERNKREVVMPFVLRVFYAIGWLAPWLTEWLLVQTGWRHAIKR